jgi:hypothetical protein
MGPWEDLTMYAIPKETSLMSAYMLSFSNRLIVAQ